MSPIITSGTLERAWHRIDDFRASPLPHGYPENVRHLFAPVDNVHQALVVLCQCANVSLTAAIYGWDDEEIDALFRLKLEDERIPVTLALDKTQAAGKHEKQILARWQPDQIGNSLVIGQSSRHAISHDKMIVIDGQVTVCGSTNLSDSGERKQNNECVLVWDAVFAAEARARIDMIHNEMHAQMVNAGTLTS